MKLMEGKKGVIFGVLILTGLLTLLQNNYTMQVLILHLLMQVRLWKNVLDLSQKIWAQKLL